MHKKIKIMAIFILISMVFVALVGCKNIEKSKGAIPYFGSGMNKEYALSQSDLYEHNGEIVLWQVKF